MGGLALSSEVTMKPLLLSFVAVALTGCFQTVLPGPNGTVSKIKTPCDAEIWLVTKRFGKPDQVVLRDDDYYQIRYWYEATRTVYGFGWYNANSECHTGKEIRLTGNGVS